MVLLVLVLVLLKKTARGNTNHGEPYGLRMEVQMILCGHIGITQQEDGHYSCFWGLGF